MSLWKKNEFTTGEVHSLVKHIVKSRQRVVSLLSEQSNGLPPPIIREGQNEKIWSFEHVEYLVETVHQRTNRKLPFDVKEEIRKRKSG